MIPDIFGGRPGSGGREPNYFLWSMVGLMGAVAAVFLVILALD